jgi:proline iminopeptidase
MVLHGGPGAGCSAHDFQYFNPEKFHIILHDQRGAGMSKPYAELKENTTPNLVEDIEQLRQHLGLGKVILFGGSWGSTLALAYAEAYPQNVSGIILRGVFTSAKEEIDHFYHGATATYFPENFEMLMKQIDHPEQKNYPAQLLAKIQGQDSVASHEAAKAWARYEGKIAFLNMSDQRLENILTRWPFFAFSLIENYYMANCCFLKEGQLLDNTDKIADIPTIIVNGRYDVICPPITAFKLHKKMTKSKLWIIEAAGHSSSEPGIEAALVKAAREFE